MVVTGRGSRIVEQKLSECLTYRVYKQPLFENMFGRLDLDQIWNWPIKPSQRILHHLKTHLHKSLLSVVIS